MNRLAKEAFLRLEEEYGVFLSPRRHLNVIEHILRLADRATNPRDITPAMYEPVLHVGGYKLSRLSEGALDFVRTRVSEWFTTENDYFVLGIAWCMWRSSKPKKIWKYHRDEPGFRREVAEFRKNLGCSLKVLEQSIEWFTAAERDDSPEIEEEKPADKPEEFTDMEKARECGPLIAILTAEYKTVGLKYWLWDCPDSERVTALDNYLNQKFSEEAAEKGGARSNGYDPLCRAYKKYYDFVTEYGEKHRRKGGEKPPERKTA